MKALMLRNIDDETYALLKEECARLRTSLNKFIVSKLQVFVGKKPKDSFSSPFDKFFGSWNNEEHQRIEKNISEIRKIDKDLWK